MDGHDAESLFAALTRPAAGRPRAVVARTVKGYGSAKILKEPGAWHHGAPKPGDLAEILAELDMRRQFVRTIEELLARTLGSWCCSETSESSASGARSKRTRGGS